MKLFCFRPLSLRSFVAAALARQTTGLSENLLAQKWASPTWLQEREMHCMLSCPQLLVSQTGPVSCLPEVGSVNQWTHQKAGGVTSLSMGGQTHWGQGNEWIIYAMWLSESGRARQKSSLSLGHVSFSFSLEPRSSTLKVIITRNKQWNRAHCHPHHMPTVCCGEIGQGLRKWRDGSKRHPAVPLTCCVPLNKLVNFSGPQFPHLFTWGGNDICLTGLVSWSHKEINIKKALGKRARVKACSQ